MVMTIAERVAHHRMKNETKRRRKMPMILKAYLRLPTNDLDGIAAWYREHYVAGGRHSRQHNLVEYPRRVDCKVCQARLEVFEEQDGPDPSQLAESLSTGVFAATADDL